MSKLQGFLDRAFDQMELFNRVDFGGKAEVWKERSRAVLRLPGRYFDRQNCKPVPDGEQCISLAQWLAWFTPLSGGERRVS